MTIERLTPVSLLDAIRLVLALMEEEGWPIHQTTPGAIALSMMAAGGLGAFVALEDGQAIGVIQLRAVEDATLGDRLEVFRFYVKPDYRHHGVGRALIEAAVAALPEELEVPVYISTVGPLRRSFERLGFGTISHIHAAPLSSVRAALGR